MKSSNIGATLSKTIDYQSAFYNMPVAHMISRQRVIADCNQLFADMFDITREALLNQTVRVLYPTQIDFEQFGKRVIPILAKHGRFTDSRIMRRTNGSLFWVRVSGFSQYRDDPYVEALWVFTEMPGEASETAKPIHAQHINSHARDSMTPRERDVAALLIQNQTAKQIGKTLGISPRTVEVYRARLLRKFNAPSTVSLIKSLLS